MTSATMNGVTTTFAYRGDGLRDSRTTGGVTTTFTRDVAAGLPAVLDDCNQYVYGADLTAMKQSGSWYYYLADGLGSTMAIVDGSGAIQKSYTYDVYGKPTATGTLANEVDFAGQQTDATGLQYLRARYVDPAAGTFASREPMASGPGWTLSSFGYGAANPVRFSDPDGLWPGERLAKKVKHAAGKVADGATAGLIAGAEVLAAGGRSGLPAMGAAGGCAAAAFTSGPPKVSATGYGGEKGGT